MTDNGALAEGARVSEFENRRRLGRPRESSGWAGRVRKRPTTSNR